MPKLKTHRGAAKRFKVTGSGNVVRSQSGKRHILTKKTRKRKRKLRPTLLVHPTNLRQLRLMLPGTSIGS